MGDLEKVLKNVMLGSVGAAATVVEKGGELAKTFVEKGRETMEQNRDTVEEIKRQVKQVVDCKPDLGIDLSKLTPEERAELRRQLDQMDREDASPDEHDAANG